MHGRVKVRTSDEEKARKEKERQAKLKVYKELTLKSFSKKTGGELDQELLNLISQILTSNPDVYTLWNFRRETLNYLRESEEETRMSSIYDSELNLTEHCLKVNPKSYCAWHHRKWVLLTRADPDWKKELSLCDKYLKLDERNFHTWDYRRFIVSQCKPSLKEEFDFTTEKLHENFSNYSAWHYRSKMLVELYPDLEGGRPIEDSHHKQELELVLNAAFTDPDDTSAWFYQRWLLGAVKETIQIVVGTIAPLKITVAFNKYIPGYMMTTKTEILINNSKIDGTWKSCSGNLYDNLWILEHDQMIGADLDIKIMFEDKTSNKQIITCKEVAPEYYVGKVAVDFQKQYSKPVIDELKKQLISCRQLLDLEPNNKWTLLTTTVFLHCIDSNLYHEESVKNLQKLKQIDSLRAGYYNDLISKWCIEIFLYGNYHQDNLEFKMSYKGLITCLPHIQYLSCYQNVDLSNQHLTSQILPSLSNLHHCKILNLENNNITSLRTFPVLNLVQLNLKGNYLSKDELDFFKKNNDYEVLF